MTEENNQISEELTREYTSTRGVKAIFRPMPPLLHGQIYTAMAANGIERPETPTYEIDTFGNDKEVHELDESVLKDRPQDQERWDEFKKKEAEYESEFNERFQKACRLSCMDLPGLDDPVWIENQKYLEYEIPEGRIERKFHYINTEFIGGPADIIAIIKIPMELALKRSDIQQQAEDSFPDADMEGGNETEGSETSGGEEVGVVEGSAAGGSAVAEDANSPRLGEKAE